MKKRTLSLALALAMCLGLLPTTALAAPKSSSYTSAGGITVNVTPASVPARSQHQGEGIFVEEKPSGTYTFYDVKGNTLGTGTGYRLTDEFHNGRARVSAYDPYTAATAYGYIDKTGTIVIPAQFKYARDFSDGLACVSADGNNWMYIDTTGARAISRDFTAIYDFDGGVAVAAVPTEHEKPNSGAYYVPHYIFIDKSGNTVYEFPQVKRINDATQEWYMADTLFLASNTGGHNTYGTFQYGLLFIEDEAEKMYLMDQTGRTMRPLPDLDGALVSYYLGNDLLLVTKNAGSVWAIINMDGTMVVPYLHPTYMLESSKFDYGVARMSDGINQWMIDTSGNTVVPKDWSDTTDTSGCRISKMVDGIAVGYEWVGAGKTVPYFFWVPDCPYAPGASAQKPEQPTTPVEPEKPAEVKTANPSNDKLTVNGVEGTPTVYNIDDSNYFKIRDVAALLNGTEKQFSVGYDAEKQSVTATTGQGYEKLPADLAGAPAGAGEAKASADAIYVNGNKITPTVYNINGNNYFKLRDLGEALDFYIGWTLERGVYIETDKPYAK